MNRVVIAMLIALVATPTFACQLTRSAKIDILKRAQVIIRAKIVSYEYTPGPLGTNAHFTFETVETLAGPKDVKSWSARWSHSTFRMPATWTGATEVIVGLRPVVADDGALVMRVVQQGCARPSIFPDTADNVKSVRKLAIYAEINRIDE